MAENLYERLGGSDAITAVVDRFYERVLDDDRVAGFFDDVDMQRQRAHQADFLSSVAGGPVEYSGDEMAVAHDHLDIDRRQFSIIATHLSKTLDAFDVDEADRRAVMDAVESYEDDIVGEAD